MTASKLDAGASGGPDRPEPDCDANDDLCAHCGHSRNADQRLRARLQELEHQTDLLRQINTALVAQLQQHGARATHLNREQPPALRTQVDQHRQALEAAHIQLKDHCSAIQQQIQSCFPDLALDHLAHPPPPLHPSSSAPMQQCHDLQSDEPILQAAPEQSGGEPLSCGKAPAQLKQVHPSVDGSTAEMLARWCQEWDADRPNSGLECASTVPPPVNAAHTPPAVYCTQPVESPRYANPGLFPTDTPDPSSLSCGTERFATPLSARSDASAAPSYETPAACGRTSPPSGVRERGGGPVEEAGSQPSLAPFPVCVPVREEAETSSAPLREHQAPLDPTSPTPAAAPPCAGSPAAGPPGGDLPSPPAVCGVPPSPAAEALSDEELMLRIVAEAKAEAANSTKKRLALQWEAEKNPRQRQRLQASVLRLHQLEQDGRRSAGSSAPASPSQAACPLGGPPREATPGLFPPPPLSPVNALFAPAESPGPSSSAASLSSTPVAGDAALKGEEQPSARPWLAGVRGLLGKVLTPKAKQMCLPDSAEDTGFRYDPVTGHYVIEGQLPDPEEEERRRAVAAGPPTDVTVGDARRLSVTAGCARYVDVFNAS